MRTKQLPQEWKEIKLEELFELKYGSSLPEAKRVSGSIEVYGSNGIIGHHNKSITKGQTIIVGRKGSIGKINLSEESCYPIDTTYYIDETKILCDIKWLFYILKKLNLELLNRSAAVPGLNRKDVYSIKIPFPPLQTQKAIVSILEKTEQLKEKRKQTIEYLDDYLQSVFYEMFLKEKFEEKRLQDICDVRDGTHESPKYKSEGYPLITSKNLSKGFIDFSEVNLISEEDFDNINKRSKVNIGDIIMPMIGTIGNPLIVKETKKFAIKNVALIKFTKTNVSNIYIKYLLSSIYFEQITSSSNRGGTQKFIALKDIRDFKIPLPPLPLQQKFASIVEHVEKLKEKQKQSLRDIEQLNGVLMQRAFKGGLVR